MTAPGDDSALENLKRETRRLARSARKALSLEERAAKSMQICAHIEMTPQWISAKVVTAFLPIQSEVDLRALLMSSRLGGRTLGIPRTENDRMSFDAVDLSDSDALDDALEVGEFGIAVAHRRATIDPTTVDLSLVPLLAFDRMGNRLGAGRAFFDRWLPTATHAYRLGVAFSVQELPSVPVDHLDQRLHAIVTENGIVEVDDAAT
jgi:5-formyltetrahydrofolate cyclo-ligase